MKVKVALFLASTSNAAILVNATHYTNNMTGNSLFSAADIVAQVTATVTATTNLRTAMNQATSDTKMAAIKIARDVLDRQLTILANKVEAIANNPTIPDEQRISIIRSAGMNFKNAASHRKRVFAVENSKIGGVVDLVAAGGVNAHEWQYELDTDNNPQRIAVPTTTVGYTEITGLTRGAKYAFFHKPIVPGETTKWEGPLYLIVS